MVSKKYYVTMQIDRNINDTLTSKKLEGPNMVYNQSFKWQCNKTMPKYLYFTLYETARFKDDKYVAKATLNISDQHYDDISSLEIIKLVKDEAMEEIGQLKVKVQVICDIKTIASPSPTPSPTARGSRFSLVIPRSVNSNHLTSPIYETPRVTRSNSYNSSKKKNKPSIPRKARASLILPNQNNLLDSISPLSSTTSEYSQRKTKKVKVKRKVLKKRIKK